MNDYLMHYNHNHDPRNGRFTSSKFASSVKATADNARIGLKNIGLRDKHGILTKSGRKMKYKIEEEFRSLSQTDSELSKQGVKRREELKARYKELTGRNLTVKVANENKRANENMTIKEMQKARDEAKLKAEYYKYMNDARDNKAKYDAYIKEASKTKLQKMLDKGQKFAKDWISKDLAKGQNSTMVKLVAEASKAIEKEAAKVEKTKEENKKKEEEKAAEEKAKKKWTLFGNKAEKTQAKVLAAQETAKKQEAEARKKVTDAQQQKLLQEHRDEKAQREYVSNTGYTEYSKSADDTSYPSYSSFMSAKSPEVKKGNEKVKQILANAGQSYVDPNLFLKGQAKGNTFTYGDKTFTFDGDKWQVS